jgi:hypothetical protein
MSKEGHHLARSDDTEWRDNPIDAGIDRWADRSIIANHLPIMISMGSASVIEKLEISSESDNQLINFRPIAPIHALFIEKHHPAK